MSDIEDSGKYLALGKIPIISDQTPVNDVFSQLRQQDKGGFLVQSAAGAKNYKNFVVAKTLAQAVLELVRREDASWIRNKVLADVLENSDAKKAIINLEDRNLQGSTNADELKVLEKSVFRVQQSEETVGLLFNEDVALSIVQTSPPQYVCDNGHTSPLPGDGYCDRCSAPLRVSNG